MTQDTKDRIVKAQREARHISDTGETPDEVAKPRLTAKLRDEVVQMLEEHRSGCESRGQDYDDVADLIAQLNALEVEEPWVAE